MIKVVKVVNQTYVDILNLSKLLQRGFNIL